MSAVSPHPTAPIDPPGPAGDGSPTWDVAELDTGTSPLPGAPLPGTPPPRPSRPDGRRRLLGLLAVVLLAGAGVLAWRIVGWWDQAPSSPMDGFVQTADDPTLGLDSEQRAFRERGRRRAAEAAAAPATYEEEVLVGPFGSGLVDPESRHDDDRAASDPAEPAEPELPFVFESARPDDRLNAAAYAEALWRRAITLRREGAFDRLAETLDRLLAVEPGHRAARAWRDALPRMQRDQRRAAERLLRDRLERVEVAIENRRVESLQALWNGGLDGETRAFLGQLFADRARVEVTLRPRWLEVDGRSSMRFGASMTIERRAVRGLRDVTIDRYDWSGRLDDGRFVGPFPG